MSPTSNGVEWSVILSSQRQSTQQCQARRERTSRVPMELSYLADVGS